MKRHFLAPCLVLAGYAWGHTTWFTVMGDTGNPAVDTIEVDPTPLSVSASGESQTMRVRVSRRELRKNWEGLPYRSYEADVVFDCTNKKARDTSIVFYLEPLWQGKSHNTSVYTKENPCWMEFRDVDPNPTRQIIRAACKSGRVKTGDAPAQRIFWKDTAQTL